VKKRDLADPKGCRNLSRNGNMETDAVCLDDDIANAG
jgi:hypothetical protein